MKFRHLTASDLPELNKFWEEHWGSREMVVHGIIFQTDQLDGFVAEEQDQWVGLITFYIAQAECEIISLNSLKEGKGIAAKLIQNVIDAAKEAKCSRVLLSTTNDNLHALGFYQKRGFELVAVHRGAVNEARKLKPTIPLMGENNIPLRDEIELEMLI